MKKLALVSFLFIFFSANLSFSQDIKSLKSNMLKRLPTINALKAKGAVGENNLGYLEFKGAREKEGIVAAENKDRKSIYEAIAKQQGTTAKLVGKRRAMQIIKIAKPGEWIQDSGGNWRKK